MLFLSMLLICLNYFNDRLCNILLRDVMYKYQFQQHAQKCPLLYFKIIKKGKGSCISLSR